MQHPEQYTTKMARQKVELSCQQPYMLTISRPGQGPLGC